MVSVLMLFRKECWDSSYYFFSLNLLTPNALHVLRGKAHLQYRSKLRCFMLMYDCCFLHWFLWCVQVSHWSVGNDVDVHILASVSTQTKKRRTLHDQIWPWNSTVMKSNSYMTTINLLMWNQCLCILKEKSLVYNVHNSSVDIKLNKSQIERLRLNNFLEKLTIWQLERRDVEKMMTEYLFKSVVNSVSWRL